MKKSKYRSTTSRLERWNTQQAKRMEKQQAKELLMEQTQSQNKAVATAIMAEIILLATTKHRNHRSHTNEPRKD